jgi:hypothetical protein
MFGVSLSKLLAADLVEDKMGSVPRAVVECLNAIKSKGLNTPGIFRISGSSKRMKEIRDTYAAGQSIDWEKYTVHDVAGTLKAYLRELPDELIPTEIISAMVEHITTIPSTVQRRQDIERCILGLQCFILLLPPRNASLLYTLFQFFSELSSWPSSKAATMTTNSNHVTPSSSSTVDVSIPTDESNGMTAKNISIIMTPNFFHHLVHAHPAPPVHQPPDTSTSIASLEWLSDAGLHYTQQMRLIEMCILYHEHLWIISQTVAERISSNFQRNFLENLIGTHSNNNHPNINKNNKSNKTITGLFNRKSNKKKSSSKDFRSEQSLQENQSSLLWVPGKLMVAQIPSRMSICFI